MTLSDTPYAIHGTDEPETVGGDNSLGCVRMLREDLEELYDLVPIGTEVVIKKGSFPPLLPFRANGSRWSRRRMRPIPVKCTTGCNLSVS
ncbi:hypothetical protein PACILC2_16540 [Paenibacillus cisolokensis]|uniref:L,D-TPase catalytic domain-containing protein n=1 Tax=Paenibacillus cisolokensis TaxID=1658519 RepID=A0ABQ4N4L0_9BACL|nr:L,D-transpeptidase [Paenibacillus cisolokensis]GIQ63086.1 hypothetical protein PACILC2_16540 [Paenibacillus cisolokensis]